MRFCMAFLACIAAVKAFCALTSRGAIGAAPPRQATTGRPLLQVLVFFGRVTGFDIFSPEEAQRM
jgi:hypothetical protein